MQLKHYQYIIYIYIYVRAAAPAAHPGTKEGRQFAGSLPGNAALSFFSSHFACLAPLVAPQIAK